MPTCLWRGAKNSYDKPRNPVDRNNKRREELKKTDTETAECDDTAIG
jgi:hypothetical protein